jgi:uncharacterized phage protein (TIGR02220 family)
VRYFVIPEVFFKKIAEKGKLYSRMWFFWLSEHVDEIFDEDFIEKQVQRWKSVSEIREIYATGVQLLQQEFKIVEQKDKKEVKRKPMSKEVRSFVEKVLKYLNEKANTSFTSKGSNAELISARIAEGYVYEDFVSVIDKKVADWKNSDWQKYLRPSTLFNKTKFENYLNENGTKSKFGKFTDSVEKARQFLQFYNDTR